MRMGCFDMVESIYGNTPDILSQLIRTMLIPKPGCEFIITDFSAIEARVLAWLAGENWRLDAFKRGEDIYCASASQMFGVPVVKHGINGELRQKGKVAELACGYGGSVGALISMGALDMGLKEEELPDIIQSWRTANPKIVQFWWDVEKAATETVKDHQDRSVGTVGFQFSANTLWIVLPSGRKLAYIKPRLQPNRFGRMSITYEGLNASNKWGRVETYSGKLVENCIAQGTEVMTHRGLIPIQFVRADDYIWDGVDWVQHEGVVMKGFQETCEVLTSPAVGVRMTPEHKILTQHGWIDCSNSEGLTWADVHKPYRWSRNQLVREGLKLVNKVKRAITGGPPLNGSAAHSKGCEHNLRAEGCGGITIRPTGFAEPVYDIVNSGPRHRFAVFDKGTRCLRIVSNCTQATARDLLAEAMWSLEQAGLDIVGHVHDEVILEVPVNTISVEDVCAIMNQNPSWADGLPLDSDGYTGEFYYKN